MNQSLKAVILEMTDGNVRDRQIDLRGAFGLFPNDCFGQNCTTAAVNPIKIRIGGEFIETDIDEAKATFRDCGALRRFFEAEHLQEGDLVLIQRDAERKYTVAKASKRGFQYYL